MSHSNISIFVPHLGCPHQCSFCNQKYITGYTGIPHKEDIDKAVQTAIKSNKYDKNSCEIAFFGGSFTAINREYMLELLESAYKYVKSGQVSGIRISTRPDYINEEILKLLKQFGVTSIELGAQSMNDNILNVNNRGHQSIDVVNASVLIKDFGFSLGLQMMTGLYKSSNEDDIFTAKRLIEIKPDTVRIYPTITLKNTYLEKLYLNGNYKPQNLVDAVNLCARLENMFLDAGIKVIRVGLHSIEKESYIAGPWHQAFRELCEAKRYRDKLSVVLNKEGSYIVKVNKNDLSKCIGQKRSNIIYFEEKNIFIKVLPDNAVNKAEFIVEEVK